MSSGHDFFMPNDFYEVFMPCFHAHTALVSPGKMRSESRAGRGDDNVLVLLL
jgi:hypothetical protein